MAVCYKDGRQKNVFRRPAKEFNIQETIREERRELLRDNRQSLICATCTFHTTELLLSIVNSCISIYLTLMASLPPVLPPSFSLFLSLSSLSSGNH